MTAHRISGTDRAICVTHRKQVRWGERCPLCPIEGRAVAPVAAAKGKRDGSHAEEALYAALDAAGYIDLAAKSLGGGEYRAMFVRGFAWGLYLNPRRRFQSDAAFPAARLLIEVDGIAHKIGSRQKGDVLKSQLADAAGWKVLRLLPEQVKSGEAVALIARALEAK